MRVTPRSAFVVAALAAGVVLSLFVWEIVQEDRDLARLESSDHWVRSQAAINLARRGSTRAIDKLVELAERSELEFQEWIASSVARFPVAEIERFRAAVRGFDVHWDADGGMGRSGHPGARSSGAWRGHAGIPPT